MNCTIQNTIVHNQVQKMSTFLLGKAPIGLSLKKNISAKKKDLTKMENAILVVKAPIPN